MAKTGITRREGEDEAEFQRRYKREYMRAYYAANLQRDRKPPAPKEPKPGRVGRKYNIVRREDESQDDFSRRYACERQRIKRAIAKGADSEVSGEVLVKGPRKGSGFTQEEWGALRQRPDESDRDWNNRTAAARHKVYVARHPERVKQRAREWYLTHPDQEMERRLRYRRENPEKIKATQKAYYHANREARLKFAADWREANPERTRERAKAWLAANPGLNAHYSARWRRECREATPPWADLTVIRRFYEEARRISERTGIPHEVDHIVPIQGRTVRGLHVHTNLRIIPAGENSRKRNRFDEHLLWVLSNLIIRIGEDHDHDDLGYHRDRVAAAA